MDFYVYLHRKKSNGDIFYVGKGNGKRSNSKSGRNPYWQNVVTKHGYEVEFVQTGMQEWWAFELEKEMIAFYGRENLVNMTDGGEGTSWHNVSDAVRLTLKERMTLRHSDRQEWERTKKIKIRNGLSEESKLKRSLLLKTINIGRKHTDQTKENMSKARLGRKHKPSTKIKKLGIERKHRGWHSEETKQKLRIHLSVHRKKVAVACSNGLAFESLKEAEKWLTHNGHPKARESAIRGVLSGHNKHAYGFKWILKVDS